MHEDDIRLLTHLRQGMTNRILPLRSARHHLGNLAELTRRHEMIETILAFRLRHGQNDLMDGRGCLEDSKGLRENRSPAQSEKLLGNMAAHAKATTGRRNQGDRTMPHPG